MVKIHIAMQRLLRKALCRLYAYLDKKFISKEPWIRSLSLQLEDFNSTDIEYFKWLLKHKLVDTYQCLVSSNALKRDRVCFSVVMPVYNTPPELLNRAIGSVICQIYPGWELVICDDASDSWETLKALDAWREKDDRIKIFRNSANRGISESTNRCVGRATGDFIAFLDHDDEIYADALSKIKRAMEVEPHGNIFYSDEDYISVLGQRTGYNFKPGFSPTLLETHNYILHFLCVKKTLYEKNGGLRRAFDGSQDYDLLLRLMDSGETFVHIPDVLYSWRGSETSMIGGMLKPEIFEKGKLALQEHYGRIGVEIEYIKDNLEDIQGVYRTRLKLRENTKILLVRTGSGTNECHIPDLSCSMKVDVVEWLPGEPFSFQLCLESVDAVLFLAVSVIPHSWQEFLWELTAMVMREDVGVVGGFVVSEDQKIVTAGQVLMPWGELRDIYYGKHVEQCGLDKRQRDVFAVSGTAMAVSADVLKSVLNQGELDRDLWDIEICMRAAGEEKRIVFTPHASANYKGLFEDFQGCSRRDIARLSEKYEVSRSPFLNPNLIPDDRDAELCHGLPEQFFGVNPGISVPYDEGVKEISFYERWLRFHAPDMNQSAQRIENMSFRPLFSIILPTYNSELKFFKELIHSLENQTYPKFEICISDDSSTDTKLIDFLKCKAGESDRIRVSLLHENQGIAGNTNNAIAMARGDYLVFCDHDDLMETYALECIAGYLNDNPEVDVLYTDEDMIDEDGNRHSPRLHPDWNPDMLLSHMYCPHIVCFKRETALKAGPLNPEADGAQDYDFFLRATEKARKVGHVPRILYSWRSVQGSVAMDASAKTYAYDAGKKALESAVQRRGEDASVFKASGTGLGVYRVKRKVRDIRCSHIIEAGSKYLPSMIDTINNLSPYPVDIVVVTKERDVDQVASLCKDLEYRMVKVSDSSNRSQMYNAGGGAAFHDHLLFSSRDIDLLDSDYPQGLLEHVQRDEIGAVGIKIIYPNGCFYHTGMVLGVNGVAGYAHRNIPQCPGYWNFASCVRNYSAVSWDFFGVSRKKIIDAGWFDEQLGQFGDVDFCLKLVKKGYRNLYTPFVSAVLNRSVHFLEELRNVEEEAVIIRRHGPFVKSDPMYHPMLSRDLENFSIG